MSDINGDWQTAKARYNSLFDELRTAYDGFKAIDSKYAADQNKLTAAQNELAVDKNELSVDYSKVKASESNLSMAEAEFKRAKANAPEFKYTAIDAQYDAAKDKLQKADEKLKKATGRKIEEAGVAKTNASSLPIRVLSRSVIIFRIPKDSIHLLPTTYHAADLSYEGSRSNSPLNRLRCGLIKCPDETLIHSSIHIQYFASHISHRQRAPSS